MSTSAGGGGKIVWQDLTIPDTETILDFYKKVIGWTSDPHDMGDYHDYDISAPATNERVTGICHAQGMNATIPPKWQIYITVPDVNAAMQKAKALGATIVVEPNEENGFMLCVLTDPAGANVALYAAPPEDTAAPSAEPVDPAARKPVGEIISVDLTVPNAETIRDFYQQVVGWTSFGLDMGGYEDYVMMQPDGEPVAGICHKRGGNADLPPYWLIYVAVADLEASLKTVTDNGGKLVGGIREGDGSRYAIIQDPAGAYAGLLAYT